MAGPRADQHELVAAERAGGQAQVAAGVRDPDRQLLLARPCIPEALEPGGEPRRPAVRDDHEVGRERLLGAAVGAPQDPHAGDALAAGIRHQAERVAAVDDLDAGQRAHAPPHVPLDERAARHQRERAGRRAREPAAADDEARLGERLALRRAVGHQLRAEAGQQRVQAGLPVRQQRVRVAALRHRPAPL